MEKKNQIQILGVFFHVLQLEYIKIAYNLSGNGDKGPLFFKKQS